MNEEKNKTKKFLKSFGRIFDVRMLPLDFAKFFFLISMIFLRHNVVDVKGEKYGHHIKGAAVFAPNHSGFFDPLSIVTVFWYRRVYFLASETVMSRGLRNILMKGLLCIKIDRKISDIEALHKVNDVLTKGFPVTVFPQGHIEKASNGIKNIRGGAVLMAVQAGVPIIPMYTEKRDKFFQKKVFVIGNPIEPNLYIKGRFPSMENIDTITEMLELSLEECRNTHMRMKGVC